MEKNDHPITINVGGELFMTSLGTLQSFPDTLLAKLANSLYSKGDGNPRANTDTASFLQQPRQTHTETYELHDHTSVDDPSQHTAFPDRSKFIHVVYPNNNNGNGANESDTKTPNKQNQSHLQTANALCPKYQMSPPSLMGSSNDPVLFVDRNPIIMPYILDIYRVGQLHLPSNVCSGVIKSELEFWEIPEDLISACCWKRYTEGLTSLRIIGIITKSLFNPFDCQLARDALRGMEKVWLAMERPSYSLYAKVWCAIYFTFILISIVVFSVSSLPDNRQINPDFEDLRADILNKNHSVSLVRLMSFTTAVEQIGITNIIVDVFFTIEFFVRMITCPSKRRFFKGGHNIVDIIILTVTWLNFLLEVGFSKNMESYEELESHVNVIFSCLVVVRVLRVFHLAKHMPAMKLMYLSAKESASELALLVAVVGAAVLLFGTAMFLVETFEKMPGEMGPFKHVPIAMWWAIITITTVGYGDFFPTTTAGYFVGVICAMSGLLLIAMPIAIIATNFSDYYGSMSSREQCQRQEAFLDKHRFGSDAGKGNPPPNKLDHADDVIRYEKDISSAKGVVCVKPKIKEDPKLVPDVKQSSGLEIQELDPT